MPGAPNTNESAHLADCSAMARTPQFTDEMWLSVEPLLPSSGRRGRPWNDHRRTVEGICWHLRTGCPWRKVPSEFGPWQTLWRRYDRWAKDGTWDKIIDLNPPFRAYCSGQPTRGDRSAGINPAKTQDRLLAPSPL